MCDTLVALPPATANRSVIFAKSADCEVNEANALVRIPRSQQIAGESVRITHLVIPQAPETHEILLTKAFWTYGCEVGVNEYGLAMGEEAVFTTEAGRETKDGVIGPDLMRLALERCRNCKEAIDFMTGTLERYGQGGNCEMKGNSHFDSSFLMADTSEAYVLETAGRQWAVKKLDRVGSISNLLTIRTDWNRCSAQKSGAKFDWAGSFALPEVPPTLGSPQRVAITYKGLADASGAITVETAFGIMRHHSDGYHPATADAHRNVCVHAGPQENRWWQADGVMVTECDADGVIVWVTGTSGTCVSIFKPVFLGMPLPDIGPVPTEHVNLDSLWWKHELLHRRAMAAFDEVVPEIRRDFDVLERDFLAQAPAVRKGSHEEKREFMTYCFHRAMQSTERWIAELRGRNNLRFEDPAYRAMWQKLNADAGLAGMPA